MFTRAGASVGWGGVHLGCWFAIEARSTPPRPTSAVHMVSLASNFQTDLCAAWAGTISERRLRKACSVSPGSNLITDPCGNGDKLGGGASTPRNAAKSTTRASLTSLANRTRPCLP